MFYLVLVRNRLLFAWCEVQLPGNDPQIRLFNGLRRDGVQANVDLIMSRNRILVLYCHACRRRQQVLQFDHVAERDLALVAQKALVNIAANQLSLHCDAVLNAQHQLKKSGGNLQLVNPAQSVREIFSILGLESLFVIHENLDAGVAAASR